MTTDTTSTAAISETELLNEPVTRPHSRNGTPSGRAIFQTAGSPARADAQRTSASVVLADDHEVVRTGLHSMLERLGGITVVAEAQDGHAAVRLVQEHAPDLVVLDILLPMLNGIETTRQIMAISPAARVLICATDHRQVFVEEALRAGASGYLLKSSASLELAVAVRAVLRGEIYLSPKAAEMIVEKYIRNTPIGAPPPQTLSSREREVLALLSEGRSNKEIAGRMSISVRTVEAHRTQVMEKLNLRSVAELTKYAIREGIATLDL